MKTDKLYISNIGKGVENSLVAVKDPEYDDYVEVSLQRNKNITKQPKIALISKRTDFDKFLKKLKNEVKERLNITCDVLLEKDMY